MVAGILASPIHAATVGKVKTDWTGNDILIEAIQDPKVQGVTFIWRISSVVSSIDCSRGTGLRIHLTPRSPAKRRDQ